MKINNPIHPGQILKQDVLPELGMTVTEAAAALQISRSALSRVLNLRAAVSADLAQRLGRWLGNDAEVWLRMQAAHDLWKAAHESSPSAAQGRRAGAVKKTQRQTAPAPSPKPKAAAGAMKKAAS